MQNVANGASRRDLLFPDQGVDFHPQSHRVQKNSYERFLQMDLLPASGTTPASRASHSVFPISDFRGLSQLEFVDYSIGNWECKCGNLKDCPSALHLPEPQLRRPIRTDPFHAGDVLCHRCGTFNQNRVTFCNRCGDRWACSSSTTCPSAKNAA